MSAPDSDYKPIEQFPIPEEVKEYLRAKGITSLNRAQIQALENGLMEPTNFVASTYTGTGKTILAHICMAQTIKFGKKMIYIAPLKSIVLEKARQDFKFYEKFGWKFVDSTDLTENENTRIKYERYDGIVMTFEKFDSILNKTGSLVDWLNDVGLLVVDEGHAISDEERGAILESALTKIRLLRSDKIKIVFLSAVLPNVEAVAKWLNAKYCNIKWRPVNLEIGFVLFGGDEEDRRGKRKDNDDYSPNGLEKYHARPNSIIVRSGNISHFSKMQERNPLPDIRRLGLHEKIITAVKWVEKVFPNRYAEENVPDPVWAVVRKTLAEGGQALVFCNSRPSAEKKTAKIADFITSQYAGLASAGSSKSKSAGGRKKSKDMAEDENETMDSLLQRSSPTVTTAPELLPDNPDDASIMPFDEDENASGEKPKDWTLEQYAKHLKRHDPKLYNLVMSGVAYHHAGLSLQARAIIEQAYKERKIKVIVSTPTLVAGVNLPARLVVFDSVFRFSKSGMKRIPKKEFVNGCGRAGRVGLDNVGIALFVDKDIIGAAEYVNKPVEEVSSELTRSALFQILCIIKRNEDTGLEYTTVDEINQFFLMTFSHSLGIKIDVQGYIDTLVKYGLIKQDHKVKNAYIVTRLGAEAVNYYLNPLTAYMFSLAVDAIEAKLENKSIEWDPERDATGNIFSVKTPEAITIGTIIHTVAQSKEFENHRKVKDKERAQSYFDYHKKEFAINSEDEDFDLEVISATMAFIAKLEMQDILEEHTSDFHKLYESFGEGDFTVMKENMGWLLEAMLAIARIKLGHYSPAYKMVSRIILTLQRRIKKMVREELLEVSTIRHIGRKRALLLKKLNILSVEGISNPNNTQMLQENLGPIVAEQVIESANKLLKGAEV